MKAGIAIGQPAYRSRPTASVLLRGPDIIHCELIAARIDVAVQSASCGNHRAHVEHIHLPCARAHGISVEFVAAVTSVRVQVAAVDLAEAELRAKA